MNAKTIEHRLLSRLDEANLSDRASDLALGAILGDDDLAAVVDGATPPRPADDASTAGVDEPAEAYLTEITVSGFRGVAESRTLKIDPGPGLTVVCGRNGTGKSSFAEAAELLLTGTTMRWAGKSKIWAEGWRNLHTTGPTSIRLGLTATGRGAGVLQTDWQPTDQLADGRSFAQFHAQPRTSIEELGWSAPIRLYRPILSAAEFDALLAAKPSEMYDAFDALLGLDDVVATQKRLADLASALKRAASAAKDLLPGLLRDLRGLDDDRAPEAVAELESRKPDLARLAELGQVTADSDGADATLYQLTALRADRQDEVERRVQELGTALRRRTELADGEVAQLHVVERLLALALEHQSHADGPCPVCRKGMLDDDWAAEARRRHQELAERTAELESLAKTIVTARRTLRELVHLPEVLYTAGPVEVGTALGAYRRWQALLDSDDEAVAAQAAGAYRQIASATAQVREAAGSLLRQRDRAWRPLAARIAEYLRVHCEAAEAAETSKAVAEARKWFRTAADELRAEAFQPIVDAAKQVWTKLSAGSSLSIEDLRLSGTGNHRALEMAAELDGTACSALSAASQGELHALALALFLARATNEASPFRFAVIDDPVQSMDLVKVYALAGVLAEEAKTRQIVVFTHDDRLPEAIRNLGLDNVTIREVTRAERSLIDIRLSSDPVARYLIDAGNVLRDEQLGGEPRTVAVAGSVRAAIDAVAMRAVRRREYLRGTPHEQVEADLAASRGTVQLVAKAFQVPPDQAWRRLDGLYAGGARIARAANLGSHRDAAARFRSYWLGDLGAFLSNAKDMIRRMDRSLGGGS
jgi:recombinational DNA repair ATPase RecF